MRAGSQPLLAHGQRDKGADVLFKMGIGLRQQHLQELIKATLAVAEGKDLGRQWVELKGVVTVDQQVTLMLRRPEEAATRVETQYPFGIERRPIVDGCRGVGRSGFQCHQTGGAGFVPAAQGSIFRESTKRFTRR